MGRRRERRRISKRRWMKRGRRRTGRRGRWRERGRRRMRGEKGEEVEGEWDGKREVVEEDEEREEVDVEG